MPIEREQAASLLESVVALSRAARSVAHRDGRHSVSTTPIALLHIVQDTDPRLGDLADKLRVKPSVASRAVAALEAQGYVERVADPADARACRVHLTDAGRQHLQDRQERALDLMARSFADWSADDAAISVRLLKRLEEVVLAWTDHLDTAAARGVDPLDSLPAPVADDLAAEPGAGTTTSTTQSTLTTTNTAWEKTTA